jgi:LacI family transcriptional regulator
VTLQQIAEHVGVSKYAVSRSLSGKDGVSERTRRTVELAARELGYIAPVAPRHVHRIQLVLHDHDPVNSEVQLRIQRGIQREAQRTGYPIEMQWAHEPGQIDDIARRGDPLVLVGPHAPLPRVRNTVMVKVASIDPLEPIDQITSASSEATAALGLRLVELGHREIVYLEGNGGLRGRADRYLALAHALDRPDVRLHRLLFREDGGFLDAYTALTASGARPSVLVAGNDWMAVGVISDLLRIGLRVPRDISVVGYGDYAAATQITPQLTTIRVPGEEMGIAAFQLLIERLERPRPDTASYRRLLICPQIIERQSLAPA